jgi:hypothetical protein
LLVTSSVNPMSSPAVTESASARLSRSTSPQRTSTVASSACEPSFAAVTEAVLVTVPQPSLSVGAITWTVVVAGRL